MRFGLTPHLSKIHPRQTALRLSELQRCLAGKLQRGNLKVSYKVMSNINRQASLEVESAGKFWDERYSNADNSCASDDYKEKDPVEYTQHAFLYQHAIAKRLTGSLFGNPHDVIADLCFRPRKGRMLALGCGRGFAEETFIQQDLVKEVLGFERSEVAVKSANERFAENGIDDRIKLVAGDVRDANLPDESFDVVFVQAAIHHFFEIEDMFELMHRVLKMDGILIYDEYVGPDHHIFEPEVLAVGDAINAALADRYRFDSLRNTMRDEVPRPSLDWMLEFDPSEGVHATQILPLTYKYFDVIYRGDYGGALMRSMMPGILLNFDFDDDKDQTIARLIVLIEDMLTQEGKLPNYHTRVVAKKRKMPLSDKDVNAERINYSDWALKSQKG